MADDTGMRALSHHVVHRRHRHRLRSVPVRCGKGERGFVEADLTVRVVERDGNIGGRKGGKDNGIGIGRPAFGNGCCTSRLSNGKRVQEKQRIAISVTNKGLKIAIAVNINQRRGGPITHIAQAKQIRYRWRKRSAARTTNIPEKQRIAIFVTNKGIKIAIAVNINQRRPGISTHIAQAKRIRYRRCKRRTAQTANIPEKQRITIRVTNKSIKIAISVNINQRRGGPITCIAQAKWICCCY